MELNPLEPKTLAPKGHKDLARGFNPGLGVLERCALKGHEIRCDERKLHAIILGENRTYSGATREAVLGLPSPNCTPPRGVGSAFRAHLFATINPGLKPWAKIFCPFGAAYGPSPRF